jgi:diamine N-acetyltransferase
MFKGEKVLLRAMESADVEILYLWENDVDVWKYSNTRLPYSKSLLEQFIEGSSNEIFVDKQVRFIICEQSTGKPVGTVDLFDFDPINMRAGVGILIADEENRGKGYAKEALQLAVNYSFTQLRLHQLYCDITNDNQGSIKLFETLGFVLCGTKKQWRNIEGNWQDEHILQLINA